MIRVFVMGRQSSCPRKRAPSLMGTPAPSTGRLFLTATVSFFFPTDVSRCKAPAPRAWEWDVIGVNQSCSSLFPLSDWSLGARDLVLANEPQGKSPGGCGKDEFPSPDRDVQGGKPHLQGKAMMLEWQQASWHHMAKVREQKVGTRLGP